MNNTAFWVAIVLAAIISAVATWGITKSYYSGTTPTIDTAHVAITPLPQPEVVAPPTSYVRWITRRVLIHDTVEVSPLYPTLDTTLATQFVVLVDSLPPDTVGVESNVSISYNQDLNLFRFRHTVPTIYLDLPVRVDTKTIMVTRDPLFWWQANLLYQGDTNPGLGLTVGVQRYSLGRKWMSDGNHIWEASVKWGLF